MPAFWDILGIQDTDNVQLWHELALTIGKVVAFIILIIMVSRQLVPWILAKRARTGSHQLFTLTAIKFFGISFALGAFFAGVVLNKSELSHRAAHDTPPLRDAFAVLFFCLGGNAVRPCYSSAQATSGTGTLGIILVKIGRDLHAGQPVRPLSAHLVNYRRKSIANQIIRVHSGQFSLGRSDSVNYN